MWNYVKKAVDYSGTLTHNEETRNLLEQVMEQSNDEENRNLSVNELEQSTKEETYVKRKQKLYLKGSHNLPEMEIPKRTWRATWH